MPNVIENSPKLNASKVISGAEFIKKSLYAQQQIINNCIKEASKTGNVIIQLPYENVFEEVEDKLKEVGWEIEYELDKVIISPAHYYAAYDEDEEHEYIDNGIITAEDFYQISVQSQMRVIEEYIANAIDKGELDITLPFVPYPKIAEYMLENGWEYTEVDNEEIGCVACFKPVNNIEEDDDWHPKLPVGFDLRICDQM